MKDSTQNAQKNIRWNCRKRNTSSMFVHLYCCQKPQSEPDFIILPALAENAAVRLLNDYYLPPETLKVTYARAGLD